MKSIFNRVLLLTFFALLTFYGCQDETSEVNNPDEQETIQPNSLLTSLMSSTTANFGGLDNILDGSNCFSVELPVTIIVSDISITIESEEDLDQLEELFDDLEDNEDFLDFVFPITIIFSDYTEIVIENEEQLEVYIDECENDIDDDVIECVDFVYPISFSVFDAEFDLLETVVIENDEALYEFLDDLEDDDNVLIVSLNYPITLVYANGETIEVNSNEELVNALEAAEGDCYDDEEEDCDEEDIAELLVQCPWDINDETNDFENYQIVFHESGDLQILEEETTNAIGGLWSLSSTEEGLILNLSDLTAFQDDLGGEWLIVECDDDEIEIVRGDYTIELEQDCEDDLECSLADINEILYECPWELETNLIDTTVQIYVYFTPNGQVLLDNGDGTETQIGEWELTVIGGDIFIDFTLQQDLSQLTDQWQIVECDDDELYLVNEDNYIALEQECDLYEGNEVFECFGDFEIVECEQPNNVPVFNLSANTIGLVDCQYAFTASFHAIEADAENNVNAIENTEAYGTLVAQVYLRIEADNGNFEIFTVYLNTQECNYFECFEDIVVEVCDDDSDVFDGYMPFDLYAIYNCPNDDVVWTFHTTIADAETSVNALVSPFVNTSNPQTIYTRVELAGDPSIFEVFEVELIVEDCNNNSGCGEEDVDAFLTSCIWNAVNYNGSDNLMNWNFDFESNSQIVVIYTDEMTIDATWTTSQSNDGVIVTFSNVAGPNIQAITGEWLVVECEEDRLELHREDDILVLERTCN